MATSVLQPRHTALRLPQGRRVPRGRTRWYALSVPEGREESIARDVRKLVPADLLCDVFAIRKEYWVKRGGAWSLNSKIAYAGYLFGQTADPAGLQKALAQLTLPVSLVGAHGYAWAPLAPEAEAWLKRALDAGHVLRSSTALVEDGKLRVVSGPLRGMEGRLRDVDSHRRRCMVDIADADGGFSELMPLEVRK
ncbi:MAG TPA: hypothetical protein IAD14_10935 [Candidatus Coprousia avicola]|nr:hypothetical protein [Candidatus Coprousia avicola]